LIHLYQDYLHFRCALLSCYRWQTNKVSTIKVFALFPYFPTFSAEPKRRENVRFFPYFLHWVLNLNGGITVALLSLFICI